MHMFSSLLLSAQNLSLFYPASSRAVLKACNLEIQSGEILLIAGPSGSGKSSLIHALSGLIPRNIQGRIQGSVSLLGKNIQEIPFWEISRSLAVVFQEPEEQFFTLKVEDEIAFGPENHGLPPEEIRQRIHQAALDTDTEFLLPRLIHTLSEGEKQKVAIAANLAMNPQILLFDEPTSNLDERSASQFYTLLEKLHQHADRAIVLTEHRLHRAAQIADRLIILRDGEIAYDGKPHLLQNPQWPQTWGLRAGSDQSPALSSGKEKSRAMHFQPILSVSDLYFRFRPNGHFAVQVPKFSVDAGEAVAVCGDNGSGKTTLLRLLAGALIPDQGDILLEGRKIHSLPLGQRSQMIRLVLQNMDHQLLGRSVFSELVNWSFPSGSEKKRASVEKASLLLDRFNLSHLRDRHPHSLSVGEKQRLAIASGIINNPSLLLLDEPTSGMDGASIDQLIHLLREHKEQGMALVIASHDDELIEAICDRRISLHFGHLA
ncbi:MAG: ATP-binding cassette domain-containing protein [bacterium]